MDTKDICGNKKNRKNKFYSKKIGVDIAEVFFISD